MQILADKEMNRCQICVMPDTRPDHVFVDGVCPACINYANRPEIDWDARLEDLKKLLDRHDGRCIVPSSGGKDSHYQVIKLLELGADPLVVTASTCHLTPIGRKNIDNLARLATTIEVSPNKTVRAKLNRLGLEMVGDISWPEHASIFSTPFRAGVEFGIPLIIYGEQPQNQYGGPKGSEESRQMTQRWVEEFGGFLGLRPSDFVGVEGITKKNMGDYELPSILECVVGNEYIENVKGYAADYYKPIEAHFLGQYIEWDSFTNTQVAAHHGMTMELPTPNNWWSAENLDNAQTGIHDYLMYLKYGYGRGCTQISVDVRKGVVTRGFALGWVRENDGNYPHHYCGIPIEEILERIGMTEDQFNQIAISFKNPHTIGGNWC